MAEWRTTRLCSEVYFGPPRPGDSIKLTIKNYKAIRSLPPVPYKSSCRIDKKILWRMLVAGERRLELIKYPEKEKKHIRQKKTWEQKMNEKRELVAFYVRTLAQP